MLVIIGSMTSNFFCMASSISTVGSTPMRATKPNRPNASKRPSPILMAVNMLRTNLELGDCRGVRLAVGEPTDFAFMVEHYGDSEFLDLRLSQIQECLVVIFIHRLEVTSLGRNLLNGVDDILGAVWIHCQRSCTLSRLQARDEVSDVGGRVILGAEDLMGAVGAGVRLSGGIRGIRPAEVVAVGLRDEE